MPLFQTPSAQRSPLFSPLKTSIDDMVKAVQELEQQLALLMTARPSGCFGGQVSGLMGDLPWQQGILELDQRKYALEDPAS